MPPCFLSSRSPSAQTRDLKTAGCKRVRSSQLQQCRLAADLGLEWSRSAGAHHARPDSTMLHERERSLTALPPQQRRADRSSLESLHSDLARAALPAGPADAPAPAAAGRPSRVLTRLPQAHSARGRWARSRTTAAPGRSGTAVPSADPPPSCPARGRWALPAPRRWARVRPPWTGNPNTTLTTRAGRRVPALRRPLGGVEWHLPRRRARVRQGHRGPLGGRVRVGGRRLAAPVRRRRPGRRRLVGRARRRALARRPRAGPLGQLCHRARRLPARRLRSVQRQAQRGQRGGQPVRARRRPPAAPAAFKAWVSNGSNIS